MTMMTGISRVKPVRQQGFMSLLSSAACEWFLIFMLLVDAAISYLLTRFALYCKLQVPCPLCSRIDDVLEKNKPGYLQSLVCNNHKEEISSLVCCQDHGKLADIRLMCEDCIMSFARSRKSTSESYQLLVGKLGVDIEDSGLKILLLSKSFLPYYSGPKNCSCCNKTLKSKSNTQRLLHINPVGFGASKANVKPPLPRVPGHSRFSRRENLKKLMDKFSGPMTPRSGGSTGIDPLSHVGYTELKITSDSESEFPVSDDEDMTISFRGKNDRDMDVQQGSQKLPRECNDESGPSNEMHQTSEPMPSLLDQPVQLESTEQNCMNSSSRTGLPQHSLEDVNCLHTNPKPKPSALPELISLDDVPQSLENTKSNNFPVPPSNLAAKSKFISLTDVLSPPNVTEVQKKSPDTAGTSGSRNLSVSEHTTEFPNDGSPSVPSNLNSDDPLALHNNARRTSGILAETLTTSNSRKLEEEIKTSVWSSSPGIDKSSKDASPEIYDHYDGIQRSDNPTCSDAIEMMQMAAALERHDSGHESIDGITVKEIEGETIVDRLKRQVEYDRRCMKALFKELEEERSAAAVAANQAMAMITRLQEEKASLHMEALQYLRMMEEQAEYDMEALEKANDLLAEKEKEVQDLEAEFEIYRNKFLNHPVKEDSPKGPCDIRGNKEVYQAPPIGSSPSATDLSKLTKMSKSICIPEQRDGLASNLEDEKIYISQCLKKLESELHELTRNGALTDLSNSGYSAKLAGEDDNQEDLLDKGTQNDHTEGENGLSIYEGLTSRNGSLEKEKSADLGAENHFSCGESDCSDFCQHRFSSQPQGSVLTLDMFRSEITELKDRLKAIEADGDILSHALNTLRNGNEGLEFIQEIAHQLQELRKIEFKKRCLSIP